MKNILLTLLLGTLLLACQQGSEEPPQPEPYVKAEYPDWYTFQAPKNMQINGVWGDIDKTLLIAGISSIHRSTDRGKTWTKVYNNHPAFGIAMVQDTLFSLQGRVWRPGPEFTSVLLDAPGVYSVDDGKTWRLYNRRHRRLSNVLDNLSYGVAIDPVTASSGAVYRIKPVVEPGNTSSRSSIVMSAQRSVDLPNTHQLRSLYVDSRQRLYIVAEPAQCGREFCEPNTSLSVVYVSKKPMP
jgi:hypothetical protein